jgi:hypothetical protein
MVRMTHEHWIEQWWGHSKRYARGELRRDEFEAMQGDLERR